MFHFVGFMLRLIFVSRICEHLLTSSCFCLLTAKEINRKGVWTENFNIFDVLVHIHVHVLSVK